MRLIPKTSVLLKSKGDHLLKAGQVNTSLYVLETGFIRAYFEKDGREVNAWFLGENELIWSILPFYQNKHGR
ncbi:hypothetical protein VSO92_14570 [Myroides pelagicus]|uniref:hypothetical protein n=1 Tax=Myroides pelagicus TaxID=270914 RepID=UPI002DB76681|nr:hypothetical protein [Myroides pelagicus]MEC4115315.1 hypothetical protein [Myroides pelagicus]